MKIRNASIHDLPAIKSIYAAARAFMQQHGNPTQWGNTRPSQSQIERDIADKNSYVCTENGVVVAVFAFIVGDDPTYHLIKDGAWHSDQIYGTIHRIAANGTVKGVSRACFAFCASRCSYLRIDTHENNQPMQAAIRKFGFKPCGIIYAADGTERLAFDYLQQESF